MPCQRRRAFPGRDARLWLGKSRLSRNGRPLMSSRPARIANASTSRRTILLVGALVVVGLVLLISDRELAAGARRIVTVCVEALRAAGPWAFFGGMAVLPAFGFPLLPFTLAAGPAFGEQFGPVNVALWAVGAVTVNITLSYWLARSVLRKPVQRVLVALGFRLPDLPEGTAWQVAFLVRLVPGPPFFVQSYLLGLMRLPVLPYTTASVVVPALYIFGVVLAGDALWKGELKSALVALGVLGVLMCGLKLWQTIRTRSASARAAANLIPPARS